LAGAAGVAECPGDGRDRGGSGHRPGLRCDRSRCPAARHRRAFDAVFDDQ